MKAVIMAGGEGTRLRPQTSNLPKPMLPLVGRPMMEHIVSLLRRHGITDIVVTVAFLPNAIRSYFGDGSELGVRMVYATEESPLGTAGSVRNAREQLTERFLVISGDVLTDIDLTSVIAFHEKNEALATIALCAVENPLEFGIVITREDGSIERFLEKPGWGQVFSDTINTGIYVLEPEIFDAHSRGPIGRLLRRGLPGGARGRRAPLRVRGRRLLGGRRHHGGLPQGTRGHPRREGPGRRVGLRAPPGHLGRQGLVHRPVGAHRHAVVHRGELHHRPGRGARGPTPPWAPTPRWRSGPSCSAPSSARTPTSGPPSGSRERCWAGRATCGWGPASSRGRWSGRVA